VQVSWLTCGLRRISQGPYSPSPAWSRAARIRLVIGDDDLDRYRETAKSRSCHISAASEKSDALARAAKEYRVRARRRSPPN